MAPATDTNDALPKVVQLLVDRGLLQSDQAEELRDASSSDGSPIETALVDKGLVTEHDIAWVYAEYLGTDIYELPEDHAAIDRALAKQLPETLCRDQFIAPTAVSEDSIEVAFANPNGLVVVDEIEFLTGLTVRPVIASRSTLEGLIDAYFSASGSTRPKKKKPSSKLTLEQVKLAVKQGLPIPQDDQPE